MPHGWDKKRKYKRDWSEYNEHLVRRGEVCLSMDFLDRWYEELHEMNMGKKGRPFTYPDTFIRFAGALYHFFSLPYRQLEGVFRQLSRHVHPLKAADYTTLYRRITSIKMNLKGLIGTDDEDVVIAVDSTGIKVTNRGEWIRKKWKVHRGWIKVHVAVNVDSGEILSVRVTSEKVGDSRVFEDLIEDADENLGDRRIRRVYADGAYDTRSAFNILERKKIEPGIKIRKNASTRSRGSPYRAKHVREYKKKGYENWRDEIEYGKRWRVESTFSAIKRIFGETVRAHDEEKMYREVETIFLLYNLLLNV